ncbi:MAG: DinB family protein [Phycisphaerales bacterium]|nr:DinB family protein [Phycisphaerales bacterium]MCB9836949.1 DinB family protein [Phycisphaera sp.]
MSNAATETDLRKVTLDSLRFGRGFLHMMLEKTPDELFCTPAFPGANHAAWVVGHLATTDEFFYKTLAGGEGVLPKSWDELFGMNSKCEADSSKYPTRTELMAALNERREKLEAWFAALTDEDLMQPITGELEMFAKTVAQLGPSLSFHDGFHAAQISAARRASGLAPMF